MTPMQSKRLRTAKKMESGRGGVELSNISVENTVDNSTNNSQVMNSGRKHGFLLWIFTPLLWFN